MKTITIERQGNFKQLNSFLERAKEAFNLGVLNRYGREGVKALSQATPEDSGTTADSWDYKIIREGSTTTLAWTNDNVVNGVNIALILQYGHATKSGTWVEGIDYINPALQPVFEEIKTQILKELK
ncbi:MAG: HK97 gp10 family phage protein [Pseudobutyrivibrio sp.]|nr:HK97 gp10 family phage protein [Pseudobutyrivibrio sp.]